MILVALRIPIIFDLIVEEVVMSSSILTKGCLNFSHCFASNVSFFGVFRYLSCLDPLTHKFLNSYVLPFSTMSTYFFHRITFVYAVVSRISSSCFFSFPWDWEGISLAAETLSTCPFTVINCSGARLGTAERLIMSSADAVKSS